jgi:hypothetical protein
MAVDTCPDVREELGDVLRFVEDSWWPELVEKPLRIGAYAGDDVGGLPTRRTTRVAGDDAGARSCLPVVDR